MATSPASGPGGGLSAPATIDAPPTTETTLALWTVDGDSPALVLVNETFDPDPLDPCLRFFADDDGGATIQPGSGGKRIVLDARQGGVVFQNAEAAPASALLGASDFTFWLDDTNGASKLMVKAKSADGTVVTAAVALA